MKTRLFLVLILLATMPVRAGIVYPTNVKDRELAIETVWSSLRNLKPGQRPRVVLVLGGGGARGLAHIGVLRVLEQEKIPVDEIIGVSVGALIGALYASGLSVDKIESMTKEIGWGNLTSYSKTALVKLFLTDELLSSEKMETYLEKQIGEKTFADLPIPFTCVATDIQTGERVLFKEGPVVIAARASATIPAVFKPVEYRHRYLVDGGLVDNLPTDVTSFPDQWNLVVGVMPKASTRLVEGSSVFSSLVRSIDIQKDVILNERKKTADFLIEPDVHDISLLDLGRSEECIQAGLLSARKSALDLKAKLIKEILKKHDKETLVP